ncbi:electron transfer flavoprotein subunit beta/FixA family protein [Euzebya tangerina]|uniref:electron transfer flavoprotein subunit beta/FixA family protein n=1 Tax=Euzebya tangerina TaxID=591198 RepID=UPI000E3152A2|nr:electron transfer flavoprotein subunit beta/FixA family protein [Euzebya tangerina]
MRIICPVKRVPDTAAEKKVNDDLTVDRDSVEAILNANDEWSIEEAMRLKESRDDVEIVALCMGPESAQQTVRKALSYGLDAAIQVTDSAIEGSDATATARVLAAALADEEWDLIIMGNQSSDARSMLVPAMLAEYLDVPALTYAKRLAVGDDGSVEADRETAGGHETVTTQLPAVVSVVEAINEPRYPSFKGIMAAKKKPLDTRDLAAIGLSPEEAGHAGSSTTVLEATPKPPKEAGDKVEDDGTGQVGAKALVDFLVEKKFI